MTQQEPNLPKFDLRSIILFFWGNWEVIKQNWMLFAVVIVSVGALSAYAIRQFDSRQIDILTTNNIQLRDQNTALVQNAATTPPSQWRRLTDQQRMDLIQALKQWTDRPKRLAVYAMAESESRQYAAQFLDVLRAGGIEPDPKELSLAMMPTDVGLMVGTVNFGVEAPDAKEFSSILSKVGLSVHFTPWSESPETKPSFDLFVGPKPW